MGTRRKKKYRSPTCLRSVPCGPYSGDWSDASHDDYICLVPYASDLKGTDLALVGHEAELPVPLFTVPM